jgi:hypothetical protein
MNIVKGLLVAWMFVPLVAWAGDRIDVDFPDNGGAIVEAENMIPGEAFSRTISVIKHDDDDVALMLSFDSSSVETDILAERILVSIKRLSDGVQLLLPNETQEQSLASLYDFVDGENSDAFSFDTISGAANSVYEYDITFTFDPEAGNAYQGKRTVFDISLGVYGQAPENIPESDEETNTYFNDTVGGDDSKKDDDGDDNDNDDGDDDGDSDEDTETPSATLTAFSGGANQSAVDEENSQEIIGGDDTIGGETVNGESVEQGDVFGASICRSLPWWVWVLFLGVFAVGFNLGTVARIPQWKAYNAIIKIGIGIGAILVWYVFDECREYGWFLFGSAIAMLVGLLWKW